MKTYPKKLLIDQIKLKLEKAVLKFNIRGEYTICSDTDILIVGDQINSIYHRRIFDIVKIVII